MVRDTDLNIMFQVTKYDARCMVQMIILLFVLTKYLCICGWLHDILVMRLPDRVRRAKGQLSSIKWKYIDSTNSKRDMVGEWIVIVICDYVITVMCGKVQGSLKTKHPKLVIRWQNLSTTATL